ncbi:MAG: tetratricopeptide repeat protein [Chitinophagales bacterium]
MSKVNHLPKAAQLLKEGTLLYQKQAYKEALVLLEEAESHFLQTNEKEAYGDCLWKIGKCCEVLQDFDRAIASLQKVKEILHSIHPNPPHTDTAELYFDLALSYWYKWDYQQSLAYAEASLEMKLDLAAQGQTVELYRNYNNVGSSHYRLGNSRKALHYFNAGLQDLLKRGESESVNTAGCYLNIGSVCMNNGAYSEAINYCQKGLNIYAHSYGEDSLQTAMIYNNLGGCFAEKGDAHTAIDYYNKSLAIRLKILGEKHPAVFQLYGNLGQSFKEIGETAKSIAHHQKALNLALEVWGEQHPNIFWFYMNLGTVYAYKKDFSKALLHLQKALHFSLQTNGKLHYYTAECHLKIGKCHYERGNNQQAIDCYKQAYQSNIPQLQQTGFIEHIPIQNALSNSWLQEIIFFEAKAYFDLYKQQDSNIHALHYALNGCKIAILLYHQIRKNYFNEGSKLRLAQNTFPVCDLGIEIALTAAKIAQEKPQIFEQTSKELVQINTSLYPPETLKYTENEKDCTQTAFEFCEQAKGLLLLANLKDEAAKTMAHIPSQLLEKEQNLRIERTELTKKINQEQVKPEAEKDETQIRKWQNTYFDYEQEYQQLIQQFERDYPNYFQLKHQVETVTIEALQKNMPPQTAMIEYFVGEKQLYIFALTPNDFQCLEITKPTDFEDLIEAFKSSIEESDKTDYCELAFELYQLLIAPIEAILTQYQVLTLKLIPADILNTIPFEALLTEFIPVNAKYADLPYLLLQYDISYHYSATLWHQNLQSRYDKEMKINSKLGISSFVGFAPVYKNESRDIAPITMDFNEQNTRSVQIGQDTYSELIYSEEEVKEIQSYFKAKNIPSETYLHSQANTHNFLQNISKYKYVLISAHGFYNEEQSDLTGIILSPSVNQIPTIHRESSSIAKNPLSSEIHGDVCSDENIFYLSDAYNLELNADLVVLSCCETGVGKLAKGEGVMSLNRGFFYAGAKNVIFTLFKVYDRASCQLTKHLFQHILEEKHYASALKEAKRQMILEGKAPIYWAGYLLIGE